MKVIVYGIGKLAEYVGYVLNNDSAYEVAAFCVEKEYMPENMILRGLNVVDFDEMQAFYPPEEYKLFIAVGNNDVREMIYNRARDKRYSMVSYISSKATTWDDLECGENVFVGEGSIIQPFVSVGNNTIMFGANVGHHCRIGNNVVMSGCFLTGNVAIGDNSFLGLNSTVNQNLKIGFKNVIGVGSNILRNTNDHEVYTCNGTIKRTVTAQRIGNIHLQ